jgi:hypothetical protein
MGPLMKAVLHNLLEGTPHTIFLSKIQMHASGNRIQQANAADPDPTSALNLAIMAEPIESPANTSCDIVQLIINDIIESMMPRHALSRVRRYLACQCIKPQEMDVRSYFQHLAFINTQEIPCSHLSSVDKCSLTTNSRRSCCSRLRLNGSARWTEWDSILLPMTPCASLTSWRTSMRPKPPLPSEQECTAHFQGSVRVPEKLGDTMPTLDSNGASPPPKD